MKKYKVSSKQKYLLLNIIDFLGSIIFFIPNIFSCKKLDNNKVENILITRLDNIWDMVLTTSFIKNIKYNFPNSKITILCRPCQVNIIKENNNIDNIIKYDAFWFWWKDWIWKLLKMIKQNYKTFDLAFELHWEIISNTTNYLISKYRVWFSIRWWSFLLNKSLYFDWNEEKSIVKHQYKQIKSIWWEIKSDKLELFIDKNLKTINKEKNKINIIIHTWVSVKSREYPILKWISLIEKIKGKYNILIIDTDNKKLNIFKNKWYETYTPKSINELIKLISDFDLLIGLESLSSHIAAAINTPLISLYSATTPKELFYPYWENITVLRYNKCTKNNCWLSKCPFWYPSKCMENISNDDIMSNIEKSLKKRD